MNTRTIKNLKSAKESQRFAVVRDCKNDNKKILNL